MQLKLYTMQHSINPPMTSDYNVYVVSFKAVSEGQLNRGGRYMFGYQIGYYFVAFFFWITVGIFFIFAKPYEFKNRANKIMKGQDEKRKWEVQTTAIMLSVVSVFITIYILAMSILAFTHGNSQVRSEFSNLGDIYNYERGYHKVLALVMMVEDAITTLLMIIHLCITFVICCLGQWQQQRHAAAAAATAAATTAAAATDQQQQQQEPQQQQEQQQEETPWLTCCIVMPFYPLLGSSVHITHIFISLSHNIFHATSIALIYALVVGMIFLFLKFVTNVYYYAIFEKKICSGLCQHLCIIPCQHLPCHIIPCQHLCIIPIYIAAMFFCIGVTIAATCVYFVTFLSVTFDGKPLHLFSLSQALTIVVVSIITLWLIVAKKATVFSYFVQATNDMYKEQGVFEGMDKETWDQLTDDKKELQVARYFLKLVK